MRPRDSAAFDWVVSTTRELTNIGRNPAGRPLRRRFPPDSQAPVAQRHTDRTAPPTVPRLLSDGREQVFLPPSARLEPTAAAPLPTTHPMIKITESVHPGRERRHEERRAPLRRRLVAGSFTSPISGGGRAVRRSPRPSGHVHPDRTSQDLAGTTAARQRAPAAQNRSPRARVDPPGIRTDLRAGRSTHADDSAHL